MIKLSKKQVNDIAQELDAGMQCYINKETGEHRTILDWDDSGNEEFWQEELEKIEAEWSDYVIIEKMSSRQSFETMESFIDEVEDPEIRNRLIYALNRSKPFRNFKNEVDYREDIRQQWFAFKEQTYETYVRWKLRGQFLFE